MWFRQTIHRRARSADLLRLAKLKEQDGRCIICRKIETHSNNHGICRLAVDHDHTIDKKNARGLVCNRCNQGIAGVEYLMGEGLLEDAIKYLQQHHKILRS